MQVQVRDVVPDVRPRVAEEEIQKRNSGDVPEEGSGDEESYAETIRHTSGCACTFHEKIAPAKQTPPSGEPGAGIARPPLRRLPDPGQPVRAAHDVHLQQLSAVGRHGLSVVVRQVPERVA